MVIMFAKPMKKKKAAKWIAVALRALRKSNAQMQEATGMNAEALAPGLVRSSAYKFAKPNANAEE